MKKFQEFMAGLVILLVLITLCGGGVMALRDKFDENRVYISNITGEVAGCEVMINGEMKKCNASWYESHKDEYQWVKYPGPSKALSIAQQ